MAVNRELRAVTPYRKPDGALRCKVELASGQTVALHDLSRPLDEGRVLYALAHPTANRRLCFSVKEQQSASVRKALNITDTSGSYGVSPRTAYVSDLPDEEANTIILADFDQQGDWSEAAAVAWVNRTVEQLFES